jgi:hypothetical protein
MTVLYGRVIDINTFTKLFSKFTFGSLDIYYAEGGECIKGNTVHVLTERKELCLLEGPYFYAGSQSLLSARAGVISNNIN